MFKSQNISALSCRNLNISLIISAWLWPSGSLSTTTNVNSLLYVLNYASQLHSLVSSFYQITAPVSRFVFILALLIFLVWSPVLMGQETLSLHISTHVIGDRAFACLVILEWILIFFSIHFHSFLFCRISHALQDRRNLSHQYFPETNGCYYHSATSWICFKNTFHCATNWIQCNWLKLVFLFSIPI